MFGGPSLSLPCPPLSACDALDDARDELTKASHAVQAAITHLLRMKQDTARDVAERMSDSAASPARPDIPNGTLFAKNWPPSQQPSALMAGDARTNEARTSGEPRTSELVNPAVQEELKADIRNIVSEELMKQAGARKDELWRRRAKMDVGCRSTSELDARQTEFSKIFEDTPPLTKKAVLAAFSDPHSPAGLHFELSFREAVQNGGVVTRAMSVLASKHRSFAPLSDFVHYFANLQEPERSGRLHRCVKSTYFSALCSTMILVNAVFAAHTADWEILHVGEEPAVFVKMVELGFVVYYVFEVALRLASLRFFFFYGKGWQWNIFDFALVMVSVYEQGMELATSSDGSGASVTFIRSLRIFKLGKILRLARALRFFRQLRLLMKGTLFSMTSLFWALVFMFFVLYVFSLVLMQGLTAYLEHGATKDIEEDILQQFGSTRQAMLSLYMVSTGGSDWIEFYEVVLHGGNMTAGVFLFYTAFYFFAVVNILTGMIVENVADIARREEEI